MKHKTVNANCQSRLFLLIAIPLLLCFVCSTFGSSYVLSQPNNVVANIGGSAQFSVSLWNGASTQWYRIQEGQSSQTAGSTGSTLTINNVQATDSGLYWVDSANTGNYDTCTTTATNKTYSRRVRLVIPPTITVQPTNQTTLIGQSTTVTVSAQGTSSTSGTDYYGCGGGRMVFTLYVNGVSKNTYTAPVGSSGTANITFTPSVQNNSVYVQISNPGGILSSTTVAITAYQAAYITSQPSDKTNALGGTVTFSAGVGGDGVVSSQWLSNGIAISGATSTSYILNGITTNMAAAGYSLRVTNAYGTSVSRTAYVYLPPIITTNPAFQSANIGDQVTFNVGASGGVAPLSYQWIKDGVTLTNTTNAFLVLTNLQLSDQGYYSVQVSSAVSGTNSFYGTNISPSALLTVGPLFNAGVGVLNPVQVEGGGNVYQSIYAILSEDGSVSISPQSYYYNQGADSASTSVDFLTNRYTSVAIGGQYGAAYFWPYAGIYAWQSVQVLALNTNGGVESRMLGVSDDPYNLQQVPTNAAGIVSISAGDRCNYALRNDGTVVAWGMTNLGQLNIPSGLTNVVAISAGAYHCLALKTDGNVVAWGANGDAQSIVPSQATNIISIYAKAFGSMALRGDGSLIGWGYLEAPAQVITTNISGVAMQICDDRGFTALLTNGTIKRWAGTSYATNNLNNVMAICGNVSGAGPVGIRSSNIIQKPKVFQSPLSSIVNYQGNILLKAQAIGALPLNYQWQKNGTNLAAATNAWLYMAGFKQSDQGNYQVVVSNGGGSVTSSVASLTIPNSTPPAITQQPQSANILTGNNANLIVAASGAASLFYQWFASSGFQSSAYAIPVIFNGFVVGATITNGGAGYLAPPQVRIVGGSGSGAGGYATVSNQMVSAITMTNTGSGYTTPPTIQIDAPFAIALSGQTNATLTFLSVTNGNTANYFVVITNNFGSVTSSVATLTVFLPPQNFVGAITNENQLKLQLTGTPNYPYVLQSATNLTPPVNWQPVLTNPADNNGNWQFTDTNTTNVPARFYRVAAP